LHDITIFPISTDTFTGYFLSFSFFEYKILPVEGSIKRAASVVISGTSSSANTYENIKYSKELMGSPEDSVVLVTNHFHVYRGVGVAKKQGLTNVEGLGAPSKWYTVPNLYLREAFAVIKYILCGQI